MSIVDTTIVDNYLGLLKKLSPETKIELIEQLKKTLSQGLQVIDKSTFDAFGEWQSDKSADEIIEEIRAVRFTNRQIDEF